MKRLFLHLASLLLIISGVSAQQQPAVGSPISLSVSSDTCILLGDTMVFNVTTADLNCNGDGSGTATVTVTKGPPPYTYLWSNGQTAATATGFSAGTKNVEVWDGAGNDCVFFFTVNEPGALTPLITPPSPVTSCFGYCDGSASAVTSTGGTPPYTYVWSTTPTQTTSSATGLCAGTMTMMLTDSHGCTKKKTFTINQPALLVANGSCVTINCAGNCNGSASAAPTGGNPPYTYSWSPGGATTSAIVGLCAGNFTCMVTDTKSCVSTYTTSITQPLPLTVTVSSTNVTCNSACNGSVTANASGGIAPYTYSWSGGGCSSSACSSLCAGTYILTLKDANSCTKTATVTITQPAPLTVSPAGINISCFSQCNGTANANAGGGFPPYTYLWAPGGCSTSACTGLCNGTYTVTVSDTNGCSKVGSVTLTQPTLLAVSLSKTNVTCSGLCNGSVSVTASGGTPAYTYSWSPGGCTTSACAGLCVGLYTVTVRDSKGCSATDTIRISTPGILLPNAIGKGVSCFGSCDGSVSATATGGTTPYTYAWSGGGCTTSSCSGLCAGTYTLTLHDNHGCTATQSVTVIQPNPFSASISSASPNPLNCNGDCNGTAASTVAGGTPVFTYLWSPGGQTTPSVSGLCAGTYVLQVKDANNCSTSTSVTFLQPTTMTVTVNSSSPTCGGACNGSISAVAGGGTPGYSFVWLPGGQTASNINGQCAGTYTVTVADSKGCANTQTVTLGQPVPLVANASLVNNILCAGQCNGSATSSPAGGTPPYNYLWTGGQTTSTAVGLCSGTYSVTVTDSKGCTDIGLVTITQPSILSSSIGSTTSSCSLCNGTANVSTTGGIPPYTFLWTPSGQTTSAAVGLCIGNYTVDVWDNNGCQNTLVAVINPVVTLTLSVSGTSVSCAGSCDGIAIATPFGGGSPYTYSWATTPIQTTKSVTGLCAGSYSVTVADVNGCIATNTVTFTNPAALTVNMGSATASCGICNGSATATPSGGTGAYTYTWSGFPVQTTAAATGLCAGNYTVTVRDANNCVSTNTVAVGSIPAITNSPSITLATCGSSDGAICVSSSGGSPAYTYLWSGGATSACVTGLSAGVYTLLVVDSAGCSVTSKFGVGNAGSATLNVTSKINPTCNGDCDGSIAVSASGANQPFTYLWSPGGQTTTSVSGLCAGNYLVQVANALSCTAFTSITLVDPAQMSSSPTITNVSCKGGSNGSICLSPSGGVSPYTFTWSNGQTASCATGLSAGTYTVILKDAGGCDDTLSIPVTEPSQLTVSVSSSNVTCNGQCNGTATANVAGGTALYTYAWNTGAPVSSIVGLCPNAYSITVTDSKGCTATGSVSITEPAVLSTTISATNVLCNGNCNGTAAITAAGGTITYTYSWLPGGQTTSAIAGLCIGNYAATVTDNNGCASSQSITITEPVALSATVSSTNATCSGGCNGTASVSASGGSGAFTYLWNPGGTTASSVTGMCAGSYTVVVTDGNGCQTAQILSISAPPLLQPNISSTLPSCFGGCNGTATSSPVGGTGAYTYSWNTSPVQTGTTATGLCSGNYTLTLSDASGCSISQQVSVASPAPLVQASGVAGATCKLCNGSISVVPTGGTSPYTYLWNTGATSATITGLCAGIYRDTVRDANGCWTTDTISVSNTSGPNITVGLTNISCFGACNGTASVTSANGDGPPWQYSWFPGNQSVQSINGLCPGQYFATVTDTLGCKTVKSVNITEPGPLALNPSVTNASCIGICNGSITLGPSGGTTPYTFTWSPGGQTTQNLFSQCAGNYTVTLRDANNCMLTAAMTIGQNTILTSTVTSTPATCNALCNGTAAINVSGGALPYTYLWTPSNQTAASVTALCAGTATVTVTDAAGCMRIDSAVITQPSALVANLAFANPLCNGSCNGTASSAPSGGVPPYTFLWTGGSASSSVSGLCAGTYTFTLTDNHSCSVVNTFTLTNPALISSTHTVVKASCSNTCDGSIMLTPSGGAGGYTFTWFPGGQSTQNVSGLCAGLDSVLITDANGCAFTDSARVGVTTLVVAVAGNDTSFCAGGTALLCSGSANAASVGWYQLPAWSSIGNTNCVSVNPPAGVTHYALIAINGSCSDTDTVAVTVTNFPVIAITPNTATICFGDSVLLKASGAGAYQWYTLPAWTPFAGGSTIKVSPAIGTTCFGVIGMNGMCRDTDSVCVTVLPMPVALAGKDTALCAGDSLKLCGSSLNATSIAWYHMPSWTQISTAACMVEMPPSGLNVFALVAYNGTCSDTDTVAVNVYPVPSVSAGSDVTLLSTFSTALNGSGNGNYLWSPAAGLSCVTCVNPTANPSVSTTYTLTITDANGCTASDSVRVFIIPVIVPNDGLSPNGDGINDVWIIPHIDFFPEAVVEVYNRWGELLFQSVGYTTPWDATYKGKALPVGTYYYIINLHSNYFKEPITGPITIMR